MWWCWLHISSLPYWIQWNILNSVWMGRNLLYINGWYACCESPAIILSRTRTYIKLMLYPKIVRWIHELLRPYKTTDTHNCINNFWQHIKASIYPYQRDIFIWHIRCCMGPVRKRNNWFLISPLKSQVQYSWKISTVELQNVRQIDHDLGYVVENFAPYQRQHLLWSKYWQCPP